jgi:acyl carrier protein
MHTEKVRLILSKHARLAASAEQIETTTDLYNVGLTSLATVALMLALEEEFDIEFPDNMLSRNTFGSIESIVDAVQRLCADSPPVDASTQNPEGAPDVVAARTQHRGCRVQPPARSRS